MKIPLPIKCTIEERKGKKHAKLHFACQGRGEHCLYKVRWMIYIVDANWSEEFSQTIVPAIIFSRSR